MQQYLYAAAPFAAVIAYLIIFFLDKQKRDERKEQRKYGKKPQVQPPECLWESSFPP